MRRIFVAFVAAVTLVGAAYAKPPVAGRNVSCPDCATTRTMSRISPRIPAYHEVLNEIVCAPESVRGLKEAQAAYAKEFSAPSPMSSATIGGRVVQGRADELAIAKRMIDGRLPSTWLRPAERCSEIRCALKNLFNGEEEAALRALVIAKRDGYAVSVSQSRNPAGYEEVWKASELRAIDRAIQKAPADFKKLTTLQVLTRAHSGTEDPEEADTMATARTGTYASGDPGSVHMYAWAMTDERTIQSTFLHELAHHLDFSSDWTTGVSAHLRGGFTSEENGWVKRNKEWARNGKGAFVSEYAESDVREDFAETVSSYILEPARTAAVTPNKYGVVKATVFKGREFHKDVQWPELDRVLAEKKLARIDLFAECLKSVAEVRPSPIKKFLYYVVEASETVGATTHSVRTYNPGVPTNCFNDLIAELAPKIPDVCDRGGEAGLKLALQEAIHPLVHVFEAGVKKGIDTLDVVEAECTQRRDLRKNCTTAGIAISVTDAAVAAGVSMPAEGNTLVAMAQSRARPKLIDGSFNDTASHVMERIGAAPFVLGCLKRSLVKWSMSARDYEQPQYFRCKESDYSSDLAAFDFDYDLDVDLKDIYLGDAFKASFDSFRAKVMTPALALPPTCARDTDCRKAELRKLLAAWWRAETKKPADTIPPEILSELAEGTRWSR